MTRAQLEDAVRAWLVAGGAAGGIPSADSAVVIGDTDTVRVPLPYLLVRCSDFDQVVGEDEDLVDDADPPTWRARGQRRAVVSIDAFGVTAEGWLRRAVAMLRAPSLLEQLGDAGIAIRTVGPAVNLSALLDDRTQVRVQRDVEVDYQQVASDEVEEVVPLEQVEHVDEIGDRTETVTEVL